MVFILTSWLILKGEKSTRPINFLLIPCNQRMLSPHYTSAVGQCILSSQPVTVEKKQTRIFIVSRTLIPHSNTEY